MDRGRLTIHTASWPVTLGRARADVVLVHGFGEHSGRYRTLADALPAHGFAVHGFDLPGHGRSAGRRGHIDHWADYRDALTRSVDRVTGASAGRPAFLYGHSMGGLIVLDWLVDRAAAEPAAGPGVSGVSGAILSAPALMPLAVGRRWQVVASRLLSHAWPTFSMDVPLGPVSQDPSVVAALRADPLNHRRASARWATEALAAIDRVRAHVGTIRTPLLVVHGGADRLVDIAGSRWLVEQVPSGERELRVYPGAYHEVHNDPARHALLTDVVEWLERHV